MRLSFKEKQIALRDAYLTREKQLYASVPYGTFNKIKDWDDKGPTVIWEGTIVSPELRDSYKVQVHYGAAYPYKRPNVYPLEPRIENQRHQEPTSGRELPGGLCLLPHNPDRWDIGLTCHYLVERAIVWLKAYENKTLDQEFAPPEIERFFPPANQLVRPGILLVNSLLTTEATERSGGCLLMPTKSGRFAFLYIFGDVNTDKAFEELTRLLSLILPGESLAKDGWLTGDWFDFDQEPRMPVPVSSAAFLALLESNGRPSSERLALARKKPQILAVRYPTTVGQHWLIFQSKFSFPAQAGFRKETFEKKVREVNKANPLKLYSAYHINPETIFRRVSGYEVGKLREKKCVLLGCGSIGSRIAEVLIKSGVGSLVLIDKEEMRAGNVSRHALGLDYIGRNKAEGLKEFLHKRNPDAKLGAFSWDILSAPEALSELVKHSDLIVSCLGNDAAELYASSVALSENKPIIYCRSFLKGTLGQIFLSQPERHRACFNCASSYLASPDCRVPQVPQLPYTELVGLDGDCGAAFIPASAIDLDLISLHGARITLALLQDREISTNYWLVRGREFSPEEYPEIAVELREPFRQHAYGIPARRDCESCRVSKELNEKQAPASDGVPLIDSSFGVGIH
jgi:hypothetical protein